MAEQTFDPGIQRDALDRMTADNNAGDPIIGETPKGIEIRDDNRFTIVKGLHGDLALEALGDIVIVVQDKYKSGFECKTCDGVTHTGKKCGWCKGSGIEPGTADSEVVSGCRKCYSAHGGAHKGYEACEACNGTGGLLVAPEISMKRPTTGTITSVGPEVKLLKVGDRILYGLHAGTEINFKQKATVRLMHEHEVYTKIYGNV